MVARYSSTVARYTHLLIELRDLVLCAVLEGHLLLAAGHVE